MNQVVNKVRANISFGKNHSLVKAILVEMLYLCYIIFIFISALQNEAISQSILLSKCLEAASLDMLYQKIISDSITDLQSQTPPLILCERKLLTLSSHVGCTDGILYAMPLIAEINGERHLYIR